MAEVVINMNAKTARRRILDSELSEIEKTMYSAFVDNFPDANFYYNPLDILKIYQENQCIKLPEWFLNYRTTLAEAYAGADNLSLQFSSFTDKFHVGSPRRRTLSSIWYTLSMPGLPKGDKERNVFLHGSDSVRVFPIALDENDEQSQLGINLRADDTRIYEYHTEDLQASFANQEDISVNLFPVFASPGDMLSRIQTIRHDGQTERSLALPPL